MLCHQKKDKNTAQNKLTITAFDSRDMNVYFSISFVGNKYEK
jgi:hypothetical protein